MASWLQADSRVPDDSVLRGTEAFIHIGKCGELGARGLEVARQHPFQSVIETINGLGGHTHFLTTDQGVLYQAAPQANSFRKIAKK